MKKLFKIAFHKPQYIAIFFCSLIASMLLTVAGQLEMFSPADHPSIDIQRRGMTGGRYAGPGASSMRRQTGETWRFWDHHVLVHAAGGLHDALGQRHARSMPTHGNHRIGWDFNDLSKVSGRGDVRFPLNG